jgi:AcrR family transcriptional regulator
MPKAFTEYEKELIRQKLLEQGYKQFSAYGLRKTNIEELAQAAGISKGAFYIFYESKEALFMDVIEMVEERFRQEIFVAIDLPGDSPRARLYTVLKTAFTLAKAMPILQFLSGSDYDLIFRRIPAEKLQEHLASDRIFIQELIARCQAAGIPILVPPEEIIGLLYPLILSILHEENFAPYNIHDSIQLLLELVAAYCLGEIQVSASIGAPSQPEEGEHV